MTQITLNRNELLAALKRIAPVVPKNAVLPILENILFEIEAESDSITLTATSLEQTAQVHVQIQNGYHEAQRFCLEAAGLLKLIDNCTDQPISMEINETHVLFVFQDAEYEFPIILADDFPEVPNYIGRDEYFFCHSHQFLEGLGKVSYAISTDNLRPAMMHIMQKVMPDNSSSFTATDARRLGKVWNNEFCVEQDSRVGFYSETGSPITCLWSAAAAKAAAKFIVAGPICIVKSDKFLFIEQGQDFFAFQQVDGAYPNTEGLVPLIPERIAHVDIRDLGNILERLVVVCAGEASNAVKLTFQPDRLLIHATNDMSDKKGKEIIAYTTPETHEDDPGDDIIFSSEDGAEISVKPAVTVVVNIAYLRQAVANLEHQKGIVQFSINGPTKALVITSKNDIEEDAALETHLLMPIML